MSTVQPVVAAIPNYNMGEQLNVLLPQLRAQDYSDIFVLDDASTDESRDIVEALDLGIKFVSSQENRGAGSTRNLIIENLGYRAIIHFIDADTDLETDRVVEVARDVMPTEPVGFIGGLAKNPNGAQNMWNYGPRQCLRNDIGSRIHAWIAGMAADNPDRAKALRSRLSAFIADWPDTLSEPVRRQIFWNIEQNLLIDSEIFKSINGFDSALREHEIQDLAIRLHQRGLNRYFDPSISVMHKEVQVRGYNRNLAMGKAEFQIHRKHGLLKWLLPEGKFKPSQ